MEYYLGKSREEHQMQMAERRLAKRRFAKSLEEQESDGYWKIYLGASLLVFIASYLFLVAS